MYLIRKFQFPLIALIVIVFCTWLGLKTDNISSDSDVRDQRSGLYTVSQISKPTSPSGPDTPSGSENPSSTKNASAAPVQTKEIVKTKAGAAHNHTQLVSAAKKTKQAKGAPAPPANIDPRTLRPFGIGAPFVISDLPDGKLKQNLLALTPKAQNKAIDKLHTFTFPGIDAVDSLNADKNGGIFYTCSLVCDHAHHNRNNFKGDNPHGTDSDIQSIETEESAPVLTQQDTGVSYVEVDVSNPPAYNSKPGALDHIYLDFNGGNVSDATRWSAPAGGYDCKAWSSDADRTKFSDAEQESIRRIWERLAEDFAPFDVNVTTDVTYDPDTYTGDKNRVGWLLITPTVDANSVNLPHFGYGGIAALGVFGANNFHSYHQPAWVTDLSVTNIAEAASHEMGHNLNLSHDTTNDNTDGYYGGHGSDAISWGPIMGTGYGRNVSQWSKGGYYNANNTQDDLASISGYLPYRTDDHGDSPAGATLWIGGDGSVDQTGVVETSSDPDYFEFTTGAGTVSFSATTYQCDNSTRGTNLDLLLELRDGSDNVVASNNPDIGTDAALTFDVPTAGTYYLVVNPSGAGTPTANPPTGYSVYGSLGQYTVTGNYVPTDQITLTSPNGGENWFRQTTNTITWASGMGGNVKIELYKGGVLDTQYPTIVDSTPNDGSYDWAIPADKIAGTDYKIKLTSVETSAKTDISVSDFTIAVASGTLIDENLNFEPIGFTTTGDFAFGDPGTSNHVEEANTGTNVYDTVLDGTSYNGGTLTTSAIDCSSYAFVSLEFYENIYTNTTYKVEVSNDGSGWTQLSSVTKSTPRAWVKKTYDISSIADKQATVYVRWSMTGGSQYTGGGVAIDDIKVTGTFVTQPYIFNNKTSLNNFCATGSNASAQSFTIKNAGVGTLNYSITDDQSWLSVSPASGNSTGEEDTITVSYNTSGLIEGSYSATITISDGASGNSPQTILVSLTIVDNGIYFFDLGVDPGFTKTGYFEYGTPEDPNKALSGITGTKIYDTDLDKTCYWDATLTSTALDCSNHSGVTLSFWAHKYTTNKFTIKYEVSNDNSTWTQLYSVTGTTSNAWVEHTYDISAVADGESTVYVRWSFLNTDASNGQYGGGGLAIDDIKLTGTSSVEPFDKWSGAGLDFDADSNGDGIDNGIAWVIGATDPYQVATSLLPTTAIDNTTAPGDFIFTYRRSDVANANTTIVAQYGSDLSGWTAAEDGTNAAITVFDEGYGTGVDKVEVKISKDLATDGKLFGRLHVVSP